MYINEYYFGKKDFEAVMKVIQHFRNVGADTPSLAGDMGVSGAFMMSLVRLNAARVVGKKEGFICIDEHQRLYRRYESNLYVLTVSASELWQLYVLGVERICNENKQQAENLVSLAKNRLHEVETLLAKIDNIRI